MVTVVGMFVLSVESGSSLLAMIASSSSSDIRSIVSRDDGIFFAVLVG